MILLSQSWLFLTVPAGLVGAVLIAASLRLLLRAIRVAALARLPLVAEQAVELKASGPIAFTIDAPRLRQVRAHPLLPASLAITLEDRTGRMLQAVRAFAPLTIEGVTRARTEIAHLAAIPASAYRLRIAGLASGLDATDCFLVIAPPVAKAGLVLAILGIIAGAALMLGGLIGSLAALVPFQTG